MWQCNVPFHVPDLLQRRTFPSLVHCLQFRLTFRASISVSSTIWPKDQLAVRRRCVDSLANAPAYQYRARRRFKSVTMCFFLIFHTRKQPKLTASCAVWEFISRMLIDNVIICITWICVLLFHGNDFFNDLDFLWQIDFFYILYYILKFYMKFTILPWVKLFFSEFVR